MKTKKLIQTLLVGIVLLGLSSCEKWFCDDLDLSPNVEVKVGTHEDRIQKKTFLTLEISCAFQIEDLDFETQWTFKKSEMEFNKTLKKGDFKWDSSYQKWIGISKEEIGPIGENFNFRSFFIRGKVKNNGKPYKFFKSL